MKTICLKVEVTRLKQKAMRTTMNIAGIYDTAQIKIGWDKFKEESPELYDYIKSFYWTLLNYFDGCRVSSTGLLTKNLKATEDVKVSRFMEILAFTENLGKNLPIVGTVFFLMDSLILSIYGCIKTMRYENRINAINKIIMDNYSLDDLNRTIAKAALEIASRKQAVNFKFVEIEDDDEIVFFI